MPTGFSMADAKWPEIERDFKDNVPVIIPLGAGCKEHGLHLPMNTDQVIAEYLAHWVMQQYSVLIAPTVTQNFFPAFEEYPGSSTLSYETSVTIFVELCTNWHQQGAQQFYVLNTGISTNRVLTAAHVRLIQRGIKLYFFDFSTLEQHPEIKK
ncbi:MAG: creatininase family protein [Legionella sp.]